MVVFKKTDLKATSKQMMRYVECAKSKSRIANQLANVTRLVTSLATKIHDFGIPIKLQVQVFTKATFHSKSMETKPMAKKQLEAEFLTKGRPFLCLLHLLIRMWYINLLPHSIYKKLELEALTPTHMTLELANRSITHPMGIAEDVVVRVDGFTFLADFVVVNFELDPRVSIILGRPFLRTAKALIDLYEEKLTLRVGKDELVYYADKSKKNKEKDFVHAISIIDFSKDDPFSGNTTNILPPSSSPMKTSDNLEKFADKLAPLDLLPPGNDDSTLKKDFHEVNFQVYSNPFFEFDDSFKSSNVNPLFKENNKDAEIKSSSFFTLTSPKVSELESYLEKDSIPPGIDLTLPPTFEVSSSNPTSHTLTGEKKPKLLSRPQEVEEIKEKEEEVSSDVQINTIVMPIRITFDNPIDFNDHFSKPKDLKKDLPISFDSTTTSILPHPSLDSDSPFTAELSASVTLNSLGNEDKVFKPGILVYHAIHDKNLITLKEKLKENISSGTLLVFKEPSFLLPPPEPPDECLKNAVLNFYQSKKTFPLNVEDVNSFAFIIWNFLPFFTYNKEFPFIFSFRSENFVFDPGILTIQFSGFWKLHGSILWKDKAIPTISIDGLQSSLHKWENSNLLSLFFIELTSILLARP
ncbi:reverse transcriptase domain-containing protein [Tanacetum coccineum]